MMLLVWVMYTAVGLLPSLKVGALVSRPREDSPVDTYPLVKVCICGTSLEMAISRRP